MKGPDSTLEEAPESTTRLGDWYANVKSLPFKGKSVVIFANQKTLLAVIIPGNGTRKMLPEFVERTGRLLERLEIPKSRIQEEVAAMQEICLLPTASRSTLGSMNDIANHIDAYVNYHRLTSADQFDWDRQEMILSEHIHGPFNKRPSEGIVHPRDLVRDVFARG